MIAEQILSGGLAPDVYSLAEEIIHTTSFQRLQRVAFLGAIDRFSGKRSDSQQFRSGTRLDHSLGVARIVSLVAERMRLTAGELRLSVVHSLLHDIGHGPFSHSSEPFFFSSFGVDHHTALTSLIEDEDSEVSILLRKFSLWLDYRRFLRSSATIPAIERLFFGPINVDTIEGILRSAKFFQINTPLDLVSVTNAIVRQQVRVRPLDAFWVLKSTVYNQYIFSDDYAFYDNALTATLRSIEGSVVRQDFYLDDILFEEKFGDVIWRRFESGREAESEKRKIRAFKIDKHAMPGAFKGLGVRYSELRGGECRIQAESSSEVESTQTKN